VQNWAAQAKPERKRGTRHKPGARRREPLAAAREPVAQPENVERRRAASAGEKAAEELPPAAATVPGSGLEPQAWAERGLVVSIPFALPRWAARRLEEQRLEE